MKTAGRFGLIHYWQPTKIEHRCSLRLQRETISHAKTQRREEERTLKRLLVKALCSLVVKLSITFFCRQGASDLGGDARVVFQ